MTMTEYLPMLALERVFNGRDHMVAPGTAFLATARRAAGLLATGAAVIGHNEADEEALEAVTAFAENDPGIVRLLDARIVRLIREAWARGLRPEPN